MMNDILYAVEQARLNMQREGSGSSNRTQTYEEPAHNTHTIWNAPTHCFISRTPLPHEMPPVIDRTISRDPRIEPPSIEECIQAHSDPILPPHPRAGQYPRYYSRAMVAYCEDVYWTYNIGRLPPGVHMPPRPRDWMSRRMAPPEDFNYVPPPGNPSIPIPPEAMALHEERVRAHREAERRESFSPEIDVCL
ncbi:hypothetical protein GCK72_022875 [Caenorhabditis remanei]|uniref:Uncharacterized protein n=1 Tax=Caenorhabditis remanei TaxID=31234 RepID=A0A6A5FUW4_CAERE|nr:hypothetical protein GCK72_022875 [Caenorhabditis remanei]KAF1746420.1 hypothetical protein GCK72_022875 [Caenorhabditis remanei]